MIWNEEGSMATYTYIALLRCIQLAKGVVGVGGDWVFGFCIAWDATLA